MYYLAVAIFFAPLIAIAVLLVLRRRLRNHTSHDAEDQASENDPAPAG